MPQPLFHTDRCYGYIEAHTGVITLEGSDAASYLQKMTTASIAMMNDGELADACLLQATGKIIIYFNVLKIDASHFVLFSTCAHSSTESENILFEALEKFHFMENFTISKASSLWKTMRTFGNKSFSTTQARTFQMTAFTQNKFNENFAFASDELLLVEHSQFESLVSKMKSQGIEFVDSITGLTTYFAKPEFPYEINEKNMPLEVGLDSSVHENKGCYPGQEVIERIRSMGQVPRRFICFSYEGTTPLQSMQITQSQNTQEVGTVTRMRPHPFQDQIMVGLGILKKSAYTNSAMTLQIQSTSITAHPATPATES